jgi:hypothetical protein
MANRLTKNYHCLRSWRACLNLKIGPCRDYPAGVSLHYVSGCKTVMHLDKTSDHTFPFVKQCVPIYYVQNKATFKLDQMNLEPY